MLLRIFFILLPFSLIGQYNCSPYHKVNSYSVNEDVCYSIAYVSCFHTQAVMYETGIKKFRITGTISGKTHNNSAYLSFRYFYLFDKGNISAGPLVKLNNVRGFGVGHLGSDIKLHKRIFFTANLLQVEKNLNYLFLGVKITT